jgi:hypothetical protein
LDLSSPGKKESYKTSGQQSFATHFKKSSTYSKNKSMTRQSSSGKKPNGSICKIPQTTNSKGIHSIEKKPISPYSKEFSRQSIGAKTP